MESMRGNAKHGYQLFYIYLCTSVNPKKKKNYDFLDKWAYVFHQIDMKIIFCARNIPTFK